MLVLNEEHKLVLTEAPRSTYFPDGGKMEQVMAWRSGQVPDGEMMGAVRTLLDRIGEDPAREGLLDTPKRVAKMLQEVTSGYAADLDAVINGALFQEEYNEPIVVRDINFYSMCEHHMLPFYGKAHVAYLPAGRVVGLSKIPRVVEIFARRLQVQERMTDQIAEFLMDKLSPSGVAVVVEGAHFCAVMRGVGQPEGLMRTQATRGNDPETRKQLVGLASGAD